MTYHPEIHHRRSIRLRHYDYSSNGAYFVTLCVNQRQCLLGDIDSDTMVLNDFGRIVQQSWEWLGRRHASIHFDSFVIMPNHCHGIVVIDRSGEERVKPLGRLIGAFKTISTKEINRCRHVAGEPFWQRNYYDRIIRNEQELTAAQEYIANNPQQWHLDQNNPAPRRGGS